MNRVYIHVIEATNLMGADAGGTSDPYVVLRGRENVRRTATIDKTNNPHWAQEFIFNLYPDDLLAIEVFDDNLLGKSVDLGTAKLKMSDFKVEESKDLWIPLLGDGKLHLIIKPTKLTGTVMQHKPRWGFELDGRGPSRVVEIDQAVASAQEVFDKELKNSHKIGVLISNRTSQNLRLVCDWFEVGRWEIRPPTVIPAGKAAVAGVQNRDSEPRGVKGFVIYEGDDISICCTFDNPYIGSTKTWGEVRDRGCWTYFNGDTQLSESTKNRMMNAVNEKGGEHVYTTRNGKKKFQISFQGSKIQLFKVEEFDLSVASPPPAAAAGAAPTPSG